MNHISYYWCRTKTRLGSLFLIFFAFHTRARTSTHTLRRASIRWLTWNKLINWRYYNKAIFACLYETIQRVLLMLIEYDLFPYLAKIKYQWRVWYHHFHRKLRKLMNKIYDLLIHFFIFIIWYGQNLLNFLHIPLTDLLVYCQLPNLSPIALVLFSEYVSDADIKFLGTTSFSQCELNRPEVFFDGLDY